MARTSCTVDANSGKTALLRQMEKTFDSVDDGRVVRYIDLHESGVGLHRPTAEIFAAIAKRLRDIGFKEPKSSNERDVLALIDRWIQGAPSRRMVLLLDEADAFLKQDSYEFFRVSRKLRTLMDGTERRFKVVFAGLHNVLRTTTQENHPLAHLGQPVEVGPLMNDGEEQYALELIREPLATLGFEAPVDVAYNILAQTNYYPSLLQIYGKYLVESLYKEQPRALTIPQVISQKLVDDSYYSERDLADSIRRNFRYTLQLDQRYEFIAYLMALQYLEGSFDLRTGIGIEEIRRKGGGWWPRAFDRIDLEQLSALLDEMVDSVSYAR